MQKSVKTQIFSSTTGFSTVKITLKQVYGILSLMFVVVSILGFCLETLPDLKPKLNITGQNHTHVCGGEEKMGIIMAQNKALNFLDIICTIFFTIELTVRFIFAPHKIKFVRSAMNIIDLLALVPLYMQLLFNSDVTMQCYVNEKLVIEIMFILRFIRMFRIFHLVKHYQALKILVYALKASVQELFMLAIFLIIGMLVFASMIYYAERTDVTSPSKSFDTIPTGFWWAIITMTMVGYGDICPKNPIGYIVGAACAVSGVLLIALTIPVISNNFTLFYTHVRSRGSKEEKNVYYSESREDTYISHSEEGYGTISLLNGKRKKSNESLMELMNGHATYRKDSICKKIPESNSMNDIIIRNSEFDLFRTNSVKARSDDGVPYTGETNL